MAQDLKYGHVTTERGGIPGDEPVVVFRARDKLLPKLLGIYWNLCKEAGSPDFHLQLISTRIDEINDWQDHHETRVPASHGYFEYLAGL